MLGGEQSGFIADIGFETYQRILNEALTELREKEMIGVEEREDRKTGSAQHEKGSFVSDCQIETDFEIMIPEEYVSSISERIRLYRELNEIDKEEELVKFGERLTDRFGPLPSPAVELLDLVRLRWLGLSLSIEKIILKKSMMICHFVSDPDSKFYTSPLFASIIHFVTGRKSNTTMKHTENKLTLTFREVADVKTAMSLTGEMLSGYSSSLR
ncbi:MAG: TRCF domain-containing protein [Bacteroidales bacterium]